MLVHGIFSRFKSGDYGIAVVVDLDARLRHAVHGADKLNQVSYQIILYVAVPLCHLLAGVVVPDIDAGWVRFFLGLLLPLFLPAGRVHGEEVDILSTSAGLAP